MTTDPLANARRSLATGASERIEDMILSGEFPPGSRINESHLGAALQISRAPVREALRRLERHGLVEVRPHLGTFVCSLGEADMAELYEIRIALEGVIGRRAARRITPTALTEVDSIIAQMERQIASGSSKSYYRLNQRLHAILMSAADGRHIADAYASTIKRLGLYRIGKPAGPEDMRASLAEHRAIATALRQADPTAAQNALIEHCRNGFRRQLGRDPS